MRIRPHHARSDPVQAGLVERTRVLAMVSVMLGYPEPRLIDDLPTLDRAARELPGPGGPLLARFIDHLRSLPLDRLAADYVDTFDLTRRGCLYLTYYAHGDTRKRGAALVRFTHAYRRAGFPPPDGELADHLGVVCNFAALSPAAGLELIEEHRPGVELLAMALSESGSPYAGVIDALRSVLPEVSEAEVAKAMDLARSGPPAEEVGLEPFGPPEYMGGRR
jgi:nitrate reductase delta subunit